MSIPYDLLDVTWGDELLRARPVKWNKDLEDVNPEEADDVYVTAYELVCPNCGGRCEFGTSNLEILCEGCESKTSNPIHISEELEKDDPEEDPEPVVPDDLVEDIEKAKEDLKSDKPTPEDILDSLSASIANTEIILEEPNENDKKEVKESKQSTKKKTKKTKKKTKKK